SKDGSTTTTETTSTVSGDTEPGTSSKDGSTTTTETTSTVSDTEPGTSSKDGSTTTTETTSTVSDTEPGTGSSDVNTDTTSTTSTTTTTETTPISGLKVVTVYETSFAPPTRVYYWSHDCRPLAVSGGLADLAASITLKKYYEDADGNIVDADGNKTDEPFYTNSIDATKQTRPKESLDSPFELYYAVEHPVQAYDPKLHMFPVQCYYNWEEADGDDFKGFDGEYFGEFTIYIGLKGDITLNERVDADDANEALLFYLYINVMSEEYYSFNENEYLQCLAFYLGDVCLPMGMDESQERAAGFNGKYSYYQNMTADDANAILLYYLETDVMIDGFSDMDPTSDEYKSLQHETWKRDAGQDFLDDYFEAHYPEYQ
ncbi:MAG: hypothetical protein MJ062_08450, partial [Oscillospiraceae bacterium]|nr:hypothetical protein [Oscillospiraceae bacterium]